MAFVVLYPGKGGTTMLKKILFLALTVALMAGCRSTGPVRTHYTGAALVGSGHYSPAPVVVYKPAPAAYRPAPSPPPVYRVYSPGPPPHRGSARHQRR